MPRGPQRVDLGVNRGVSPGWNAAAAAARAPCWCSPTTTWCSGRERCGSLHDALIEHEQAGVVGSPTGARWDLTVPKHLERLDLRVGPPAQAQACEVVSGYLFAMRNEVWEALGGFDEAYAPCSMEEVDLCTTSRLRLGLKCYAVAGVEVEHEYGISVATRGSASATTAARSSCARSTCATCATSAASGGRCSFSPSPPSA